mgnify:CR=1 FL=1
MWDHASAVFCVDGALTGDGRGLSATYARIRGGRVLLRAP